jgi:hypothetical protein
VNSIAVRPPVSVDVDKQEAVVMNVMVDVSVVPIGVGVSLSD